MWYVVWVFSLCTRHLSNAPVQHSESNGAHCVWHVVCGTPYRRTHIVYIMVDVACRLFHPSNSSSDWSSTHTCIQCVSRGVKPKRQRLRAWSTSDDAVLSGIRQHAANDSCAPAEWHHGELQQTKSARDLKFTNLQKIPEHEVRAAMGNEERI